MGIQELLLLYLIWQKLKIDWLHTILVAEHHHMLPLVSSGTPILYRFTATVKVMEEDVIR
ncbi:hypothetical protein V7127_20925 [Bacillus sp. JJ1773]|uniref:hypothetical protein n=1 Tax=Bacillus sp. JJ1773 TaxID=3122965 RepID=UPI002FFF150B